MYSTVNDEDEDKLIELVVQDQIFLLPEAEIYTGLEEDLKRHNVKPSEYYDGIVEDLNHEASWKEMLARKQTLPRVQQETLERWENLTILQNHYKEFTDFVYDAMTELLGFRCTTQQLDIAEFLQYGPDKLMVQAQRSQAKSTIIALFGAWAAIHNPKMRFLVLSAGADVAMEIANWVIQVIMEWDILEPLRPDRQHGDRASSKSFDINWQLKGVEKSPSIACIGVTANMQGRRADILVPDDIESSKNGLTEVQRQQLIHKSKDFTSICTSGRILYAGTPQTSDSIYNTLPERGYTVRVWPGRFPTLEQEDDYGNTLAPSITRRMTEDPSLRSGCGLDGTLGAPTDADLLPEDILVSKEHDQGPAYFQLQHMLNTKLMDLDRYPLNTRNLMFMHLNPDKAPSEIIWMPDKSNQIDIEGYANKPEFYRPYSIGKDLYEYESRYMYVDTSGGGRLGDETVAWALNFLHGYMFGMEMLVLPGGYSQKSYLAMSEFAYRNKVNEIGVEQNHGHGAFAQNWRPELLDYYEKMTGKRHAPQVVDDWVSQQKELRIIDVLEPALARHTLVINESILDYDIKTALEHPIDVQQSYTFVNQMNKITRVRGALIHDDRVDSYSAAVRRFVDSMAISEQQKLKHKASSETLKMFSEYSKDFAHSLKPKMGNIKSGRGTVRQRVQRKQNRKKR